jgi:small subunit ribosomal protein S21
MPTEIVLSDTDRIEWAIKAFKRAIQQSGVLRELRRRRHYVKPSEARQLKSKAAQRARAKAASRRRSNPSST